MILNLNNSLLIDLIKKLDFKPTCIGRTDENPSAWYSEISKVDFSNIIINHKVIFNNHPFSKKTILDQLGDSKIYIQLFWII